MAVSASDRSTAAQEAPQLELPLQEAARPDVRLFFDTEYYRAHLLRSCSQDFFLALHARSARQPVEPALLVPPPAPSPVHGPAEPVALYFSPGDYYRSHVLDESSEEYFVALHARSLWHRGPLQLERGEEAVPEPLQGLEQQEGVEEEGLQEEQEDWPPRPAEAPTARPAHGAPTPEEPAAPPPAPAEPALAPAAKGPAPAPAAKERPAKPGHIVGAPMAALLAEEPEGEENGPGRVCPICFDEMEPSEGQSFCGVHLLCAECASRSARAELRRGRVPRCPDCHVEVEPVAAQQLLDAEDLERYHRLALWSNDGVTACPRCQEGLYADAGTGEDPGASCGTAFCPSCSHEFCVECRNPAHKSLGDCDEAARIRKGGRAAARRRPTAATVPSDDGTKLAAPFPCSVSAVAPPPMPNGASLNSAVDTLSLFGALNLKRCPRCRAPVEKLDEESCDHMTCSQCRHEFCWSCLADRVAIYAHGNHFHRPRCRFYAPYSGPPEYIPEKCRRCAHRGAPCTPPNSVAIDAASIAPSSQMGSLDTWLRTFVELVTLRSCQMLPR